MNFMRDVYTLAANSDQASNSPAPSHNFQPSTGLSSQFTQGNQSYYSPPYPYLRPLSSQGQSPAPNLPAVSTPYLVPISDPQQSYGSWSAASTPPVPLSSPPQLNTVPWASNPAITSPNSSRPYYPQSPLSASASPQSYGFPLANGQYQQFPERPPSPERSPFASSRPHGQSFPPWGPYAGPHAVTPEALVATPSFTPAHPSLVPPVINGYHSQNGHSPEPAELSSAPSPPTPLPSRPWTQPPSSVSGTSTAPPSSNLQQLANANRPTLTVLAPASTTIYHEMPSEPLQNPAPVPQIRQENDSHSPLELDPTHVPRPPQHTMQPFGSSINPQTYGPTIGVFELAASPVSFPTRQSESSAGQTESATVSHPNSSSAAFPRQSVPSQVVGHHSPSAYHNSSSAVSPLREVASPQVAVYQPSTPQHHSGLTVSLPAPGVLQPAAAHQSSSLQYTSVDVHQMLPAADGLDPRRTISWPSSSAPASELPHPRPENSPSPLTMAPPRDSKVGTLSTLEAYNYQTPTASNIANQVYPIINPQDSVSLRPFHDSQSQWPTNPQQAAQGYNIPANTGMTSHPGDR